MFDVDWREILDRQPSLEYFKASEAESLRPDGQWAGVSREQRNQRIDSLIQVIGRHAIRAIYVRLMQKDYDEVIKPYVPEMWQSPYYFLFIGFVSAAASAEHWGGRGRDIEFFFDRTNRGLQHSSRKLYKQVSGLSQFANVVNDIHYEDEKIFLPLQAADLLAWQVRRRFSVTEQPRPQFEAALNSPPQKPYSYELTRARLEELGEVMDQHAMLEWAIMGYPERLRKWRRPRKLS